MGFAVILNENQNGTELTKIPYTNNDNYRDEWEIYKLNYYAVVYNYYNSGYNESGTASQQKIDEYNYAIAERYMQLGLFMWERRIYEKNIRAFYDISNGACRCMLMRKQRR